MYMKSLLNKNLPFLLLAAYLYLAVFSLFTMSGHEHMPMTDCPYMVGQHSLCVMDTFAHLNAWKTIVLAVPNVIYIFTLLTLTYFVFQILLSSSPPLIRQLLYSKRLSFEPIVSNTETQFSDGLLNPKPY